MVVFVPLVFVVLSLIAVALAWRWLAGVRVSPQVAPVMATRVAFPGGLRLVDIDQALALIDRPDEVVIPFDHAILVIDYPLTTPATIEVHAARSIGFTRGELVRTICDEYQNVYEAEEGTAAVKTIPPDERGAQRQRNRTDGAYGIWGHDLDDLVVTSARWTRSPNGMVTIELAVES